MAEVKKRSHKQVEAYIEMNVNKISDSEIIQEIMKDGIKESEIRAVIERKRNNLRNINLGLILGGIAAFVLGTLLTISTYESVSYYGGTYYIFYGLMIVGPVSIIIGIVRMLSKSNK